MIWLSEYIALHLFRPLRRGGTLPSLLALFVLVLMPPGFGQIISGRVYDRFNLTPVPGATVTVEQEGAWPQTVLTSAAGEWRVTLAPEMAVEEAFTAPGSFTLEQNYPNPFNPATWIAFQIPQQGQVVLSVYNSIGQMVDSRQAVLAKGFYRIRWRARGPAGVYFYKVHFGAITRLGKMVQLDRGHGEGLGGFERTMHERPVALSKQSVNSVRLIINKLAYIPDTTAFQLSQDRVVDTGLQQVHHQAVVVDLHNDIVEQMAMKPSYRLADEHSYLHTDLPRLKTGGVDLQVFALWVNPATYPNTAYQKALDYFDLLQREFNASPHLVETALTIEEAERIWQARKISAVLAVEGGHVIEEDLGKLIELYRRGMRMMTITWNNSTSWAVSAKDARSETVGLSEFGRRVIRTLDSLGVIIDISHTGKKTVDDILAASRRPLIASHSGVAAVRPHYRNLDEAQIRAIAQRGGVIGVIFYPPYLAATSAVSIEAVVRHIDAIVQLVGVDYVALGSDFDGIERTVVGLNDVSCFPALTRALFEHGYSRREVEKIVGGNFLRVFKQVCSSPSDR